MNFMTGLCYGRITSWIPTIFRGCVQTIDSVHLASTMKKRMDCATSSSIFLQRPNEAQIGPLISLGTRVLEVILDLPVCLKMRQVFAACGRPLSKALLGKLRRQRIPMDEPAENVTTNSVSRVFPLKYLDVAINGHPFTALADDGSSINLLRQDVADSLNLPIIQVNTIGSVKSELKGLVENVPIKIGDYVVACPFYVIATVWFPLAATRTNNLSRPRHGSSGLNRRLLFRWFVKPREFTEKTRKVYYGRRQCQNGTLGRAFQQFCKGMSLWR